MAKRNLSGKPATGGLKQQAENLSQTRREHANEIAEAVLPVRGIEIVLVLQNKGVPTRSTEYRSGNAVGVRLG